MSNRHLYRVTVQVTLDMVVLAESPEQARDWTADDNWLDEVDRGCPEVRVLAPTRIRDAGELPDRGWLDAHPYAADGTATKETVKEMLSARGTDG